MKPKLIASAPSKEGLEKCINEFYASKHWRILDDMKVYNDLVDRFAPITVTTKRGRWYAHVEAKA